MDDMALGATVAGLRLNKPPRRMSPRR